MELHKVCATPSAINIYLSHTLRTHFGKDVRIFGNVQKVNVLSPKFKKNE